MLIYMYHVHRIQRKVLKFIIGAMWEMYTFKYYWITKTVLESSLKITYFFGIHSYNIKCY